MEDFRVDVIVGKGPGATAIPLELAPFTLIGATTRAGLLTGPLRDRFGFTGRLDFYSDADLVRILTRSATLLGVRLEPDGAREIAGRSRGTPRIANRLLRRVRDFAEVRADGIVTRAVAREALAIYDVDDFGLDRPRPECSGLAGTPLRRRPGRRRHPRRRCRGGGGDDRGSGGTVPRPSRPTGANSSRADSNAGRLDPFGPARPSVPRRPGRPLRWLTGTHGAPRSLSRRAPRLRANLPRRRKDPRERACR